MKTAYFKKLTYGFLTLSLLFFGCQKPSKSSKLKIPQKPAQNDSQSVDVRRYILCTEEMLNGFELRTVKTAEILNLIEQKKPGADQDKFLYLKAEKLFIENKLLYSSITKNFLAGELSKQRASGCKHAIGSEVEYFTVQELMDSDAKLFKSVDDLTYRVQAFDYRSKFILNASHKFDIKFGMAYLLSDEKYLNKGMGISAAQFTNKEETQKLDADVSKTVCYPSVIDKKKVEENSMAIISNVEIIITEGKKTIVKIPFFIKNPNPGSKDLVDRVFEITCTTLAQSEAPYADIEIYKALGDLFPEAQFAKPYNH